MSVFVPDESGMGGDYREPGEVYWESDALRWYVFVDQFVSRPASEEEVARAQTLLDERKEEESG